MASDRCRWSADATHDTHTHDTQDENMTGAGPHFHYSGYNPARHGTRFFMAALLRLVLFVMFCVSSAGWVTSSKRQSACFPREKAASCEAPHLAPTEAVSRKECGSSMSRRLALSETIKCFSFAASSLVVTLSSTRAFAGEEDGFRSAAYSRSEYTNSIVASRDTNVSPKEVYDVIRTLREKGRNGGGNDALDVGAGAGVSTQTLYDMGYTTIDALDWSSDAWDLNVVQNGHCPDTVRFYNLDDERFLQLWRKSVGNKYDVIVFNFAVNRDKAVHFATELLKSGGVLLAPVNSQQDYWLKQTYQVLSSEGKLLWSASDVGAWSVQFQPDVTQDTCQGIWCPPFNGFRKQ